MISLLESIRTKKLHLSLKMEPGKNYFTQHYCGEKIVPISDRWFLEKVLKWLIYPKKWILPLDLTVEESIFKTDNPILKIIEAYEHALEHPEDSERYQKAFDEMELHHAWDFETQYKQIYTS
jgi:ATP-binding cassette subfamily F protein uup